MQHHLTRLGSRPGSCRSAACSSVRPGLEVEGELVAGDLPGGDRAAYVEGVRRPQRQQLLCAPFATAVSRSRASARSSSPVSWLVPPKETCWWSMREVPTVRGLLGVLGGLVGHEPGDRLGDQPLQRGDADAVRERRHLRVHERRRFGWDRLQRRLRDPTGPPGLEVTGLHPCPAPREPVLQLHRRRDLCPSAVGGAADREGELGDAELRHQRCAFTGEGEAGVSAGGDPGGCLVDRLRWVLLGPGHRGDQQVGLCLVGCGLAFAGEHQHLTRGVEVSAVGVGGCCHE